MNYNLQVKPVNSQTSPSLSPYVWKDLTVDVAEILLRKLQYFHKLFISTLWIGLQPHSYEFYSSSK